MATIYDYHANTIKGTPVQLKDYEGQVVVIANTASECGLTPQYEGLQKLYEQYKDRGLVVLGFPCNQFGGQEPGTSTDIQSFCSLNYGVTFPMFEKVDVKGPNAHPLFVHLTGGDGELVPWNFTKFLIGKDGKLVKRFEPPVQPADMTEDIEALL